MPSRDNPMASVDHFWFSMDEPTNLMVIAGVLEFDAPLDFDELCKMVEERFLPLDRFRQKIVKPLTRWQIPRWQEDELFDIRSHVHRIALPSPADKKALEDMVSDLMAVPLDDTKPLWQVHLIENFGKGCAILFRIHHCIADGTALIHVLLSTAETTPGVAPPPPIQKHGKGLWQKVSSVADLLQEPKKGADQIFKTGQKFLSQGRKTVSEHGGLIGSLKHVRNVSVDTAKAFPKLTLMRADSRTAFKGKLRVSKSAAWTDQIPIEEIKAICRHSDATINDVFMATVTGALRTYLSRRNDPVDDLEIRVTIPIDIRKPGTAWRLGNHFTLVYLTLPIHLADPILRLREVKRRMDYLKQSQEAFAGFQMLNAMGRLPARVAKKLAIFYSRKATAILTNVPGPKQPLYYLGKEIKNLRFWVPRTGDVGLGISIFSYNGHVNISIAADGGLVPDPEVLVTEFEKEFYKLQSLMKARQAPMRTALKGACPQPPKTPAKSRKITPPLQPGMVIENPGQGINAPYQVGPK